MKKTFKKTLASIMSAVSLAMCVTGMSASAISSTTTFSRDAGSPGDTGNTSAVWNYTTSVSESKINVSNFTCTNSGTYIMASIAVEGELKASGGIFPTSGSVSASNLPLGKSAYASAYVVNVSGTIRATVSITG